MSQEIQEEAVIIVGAGSSGLATAGCLTNQTIPYRILEREDCFASLWQNYSYDRLRLHLPKQLCRLPHMDFPSTYPTFVPKTLFLRYLNDYVLRFQIQPAYRRSVEDARYNESTKKWLVKAKNLSSGEVEEYSCRFLVVASGKTTNPYTAEVEGLRSFSGEVIHSTQFKNGESYKDKNVLVVGSGNSGMEIALELAEQGAHSSIVIRSPIHIVSREIVYVGVYMLKYLPLNMVDSFMVMMSKIVYGDLSKFGIKRPKEGPFFMSDAYGKYPIVDVGTIKKIRSAHIQVLPGIERIRGKEVVFENGKSHYFDTIVFCTGFKRSTHMWLKDDDYMLNEDGMPKQSYPNHWKGKNGLYCVGLSRRGFYGAADDAQRIANHIKSLL